MLPSLRQRAGPSHRTRGADNRLLRVFLFGRSCEQRTRCFSPTSTMCVHDADLSQRLTPSSAESLSENLNKLPKSPKTSEVFR